LPPETYPVIERIDEMSENKEYPKYVALQSDGDEPGMPFEIEKSKLPEYEMWHGFSMRLNTHEELQDYLENIIITDPGKEEVFNKMVYPRLDFETPKRKGR